MLRFALAEVEQERGLVLQINLPESTLPTRLPGAIVIESVKVLKSEFFSLKVEADAREPPRDLKKDNFSARLEVLASEALNALRSDVCSTKLEAAVIALLNDLNRDDFSTKPEAELRVAVRLLTKVVFSELAS